MTKERASRRGGGSMAPVQQIRSLHYHARQPLEIIAALELCRLGFETG